MKRSIVVAGIVAAAAAAVALAFLLAPRGPRRLTLSASVDENARAALESALAEYGSSRTAYSAALAGPDAEGADLYVKPWSGAEPGVVPWRGLGWRLWARQETLAALESRLGRGLILPLRERRVDAAALEGILAAAGAAGLRPLAQPVAPPDFASALRSYQARLSSGGASPDWSSKGWIDRPGDLAAATRALETGRALFILGPDALGPMLPRSADCHVEGFPLPTTDPGSSRWSMGEAYAFALRDGKKIDRGAADLVAYLTSPGLARRFAAQLPGEFYSWKAEPKAGELPVVDAPTEFLDLGGGR